jgi:serine/threonine protein kinase
MGCGGSKPEEKKSGGGTSAKASNAAPAGGVSKDGKTVDVMGKYTMMMTKDAIMGEGTSSICRRGFDKQNNEVAIKVYKDQTKGGGKLKDVTIQKFKRQIAVLRDLMAPFKKPSDPALWDPILENVKPERVFMQLLDYSKDAKGEPGPDAKDGVLYVVTELAGYSLKDWIAQRRDQGKPLSKDEVRNMSKAIVVAMAGLHAKGYVHIDMKPENMMDFNGKLKVIDVDGCVKMGTKVSIHDSSISFSPCYCAPEWAKFLIKDNQPNIIVQPSLDVWSVGMTLCELVTLDAILKPQYANFLRNASSHREAGFLFMEWLSGIRKAPLPKSVSGFDPGLVELLSQWLLVCNASSRKSCAQALQNAYIKGGVWEAEPKTAGKSRTTVRIHRERREDDSTLAPLFKGTLWKLNTGADKKDDTAWIKRDMWIAHNHSLCYYSVKENKRLVLIDGTKLTTSKVLDTKDCAKPNAFEIRSASDEDSKATEIITLAAESGEELTTWKDKISKTGKMDMIVTMVLGSVMAAELQEFKLAVSNRRIKVEEDEKSQFEPAFKGNLKKLKTEGDKKKADDWFEREFWIAKNGSMVYYSPKEERELVYYTASDVGRAKITTIPDAECHHKNAFQVQLPPVNGVEFAPGVFACESEQKRKDWIAQFTKFSSAQG